MTIEDQIAELLAQAEPLRALPDEIAEAKGLPSLVDRINRLRALQSFGEAISNEIAAVEGADAVAPKRGPGRPKKAE